MHLPGYRYSVKPPFKLFIIINLTAVLCGTRFKHLQVYQMPYKCRLQNVSNKIILLAVFANEGVLTSKNRK